MSRKGQFVGSHGLACALSVVRGAISWLRCAVAIVRLAPVLAPGARWGRRLKGTRLRRTEEGDGVVHGDIGIALSVNLPLAAVLKVISPVRLRRGHILDTVC